MSDGAYQGWEMELAAKARAEADGLDTQQFESFERAEHLARDLMAELYRLRSLFHPLSEVWHHVPHAQSLLEKVKGEVAKAREVGRAERASGVREPP